MSFNIDKQYLYIFANHFYILYIHIHVETDVNTYITKYSPQLKYLILLKVEIFFLNDSFTIH